MSIHVKFVPLDFVYDGTHSSFLLREGLPPWSLWHVGNARGLEPICLSNPTKPWHFGGWVVWWTTCTCIIFPLLWQASKPSTATLFRFHENHMAYIKSLELSRWRDEGGFPFICLHRWRYLECGCLHDILFLVVLRAFFLLYMELILSIKVATKDFPLTPHHTILPGVTDMFFARRMRSTSKFAMTVLSKCVSHVGSTNWPEPCGEYLSR